MADTAKQLLETFRDGEWLILSKNSLFWKARLDPSEENAGSSILSISYGKSLCQALKAETSQAFEHSTREKAIAALTKLVKEKSKNGYELYSEPSEEKENRPETRPGKASPLPIKGGKIDVEAIEHQCLHIPLILTEDFEERTNTRTAEKKRDQGDASLGKRQRSTEAKAAIDEMSDHQPPASISISDVLNKNSKKFSSRQGTAQKDENLNVEATPLKEEQAPKSASRNNTTKSKLSILEKTNHSQTKKDEVMDEEKPSVQVNELLEKKVSGRDLYNVTNNTKLFTTLVLVQVFEQWLYLEYSVDEDMSINRKKLLKLESNEAAAVAAHSQIERLQESGFKKCDSEPPILISIGTISTLTPRIQIFQDCTDISPDEIAEAGKEIFVQATDSSVEKGIEKEEKITEKQVIITNLDYDLLSHSEASLHEGTIKDLPSVLIIDDHKEEKLREYERYKKEMEKGTVLASNRNVQPLGPSSQGMIAVMLLNQYKNMDVSSSRFLLDWLMSEKLDGVRCIWTGKKLITRNGTVLSPPAFFLRAFPNSCLDGELYAAKRGYKRVIQVLTEGIETDWLDLAFWVFDAPLLNLQYIQRYNVTEGDPDATANCSNFQQQLHTPRAS